MMFEPTEHYGINDVREWESLSPGLNGWVYLTSGGKATPYALSMFHRVHCLNFIRYYLKGSKNGNTPTADEKGHANHCYNYIKDTLLCGSDITLEPRIVEQVSCENPAPAASIPHVCRDWAQVRNFIEDNYRSNLEEFAKGL
ncbi:hypothetical protein MD484_g3059, partial [Candolleomyces efflorescens]